MLVMAKCVDKSNEQISLLHTLGTNCEVGTDDPTLSMDTKDIFQLKSYIIVHYRCLRYMNEEVKISIFLLNSGKLFTILE